MGTNKNLPNLKEIAIATSAALAVGAVAVKSDLFDRGSAPQIYMETFDTSIPPLDIPSVRKAEKPQPKPASASVPEVKTPVTTKYYSVSATDNRSSVPRAAVSRIPKPAVGSAEPAAPPTDSSETPLSPLKIENPNDIGVSPDASQERLKKQFRTQYETDFLKPNFERQIIDGTLYFETQKNSFVLKNPAIERDEKSQTTFFVVPNKGSVYTYDVRDEDLPAVSVGGSAANFASANGPIKVEQDSFRTESGITVSKLAPNHNNEEGHAALYIDERGQLAIGDPPDSNP